MTTGHPAPRAAHPVRTRWVRVAGLVAIVAAIAVSLARQQLPAASPSTTALPLHAGRPEQAAPSSGPGIAGGAVPEGTSVFDDGVPGVAGLDPALLGALGQAASSGVTFVVDSGWRSPAYQEHLLRRAVLEYGSEESAARWVATRGRPAMYADPTHDPRMQR